MFLKSLTLKGFKSFADSTTLEFEPGVTVVVGPNGSGKSNIVDAVAWVLGAQGPRTLRSAKMEDVIFAGTASRPALGRAEVSLTIDNGAGLLPIELSEVTITRTLFRTGDSEYAINGVPCRLLDVQELLSDSGVGRQQHVIVSQGQLDSVLNARPEDRRLVVEEAAGVLKYRRRRERAQRRLESTEANLTRLNDLLREVRRQLRPLERQAEAARRHVELAEELHQLRLYVSGLEVAALETRLGAAASSIGELGTQEAALRSELARLDVDVHAAEVALSAQLGEDGLAEALGRLESTRQRARGLAALLAERRRSVERDLAASRDEGVVASLESDAAALATQLAEVDQQAAGLGPEMGAVEEAEASVAAERAAFAQRYGDEEGPGDTSAAELRVRLNGLTSAMERDRASHSRLVERRSSLEARAARLEGEAQSLQARLDASADAAPRLAEHARRAADDLRRAEEHLEATEAASADAARSHHGWQARAEALALALDQAAARAGAERLAGLAGLVGTLAELVEVDPGWEAAFEAAAGEALVAVVVEDVQAARTALRRLAADGATGAVLVLGLSRPRTGAPSAGDQVRAHVRSGDPRVESLLDAVLGGAVVVGDWEEALTRAAGEPDRVVLSAGGDRFAPTGWRTGAAGSGATGAALDEARQRAEEALAAAGAAAQAAEQARADLARARAAHQQAAAALAAGETEVGEAEAGLARARVALQETAGERQVLDAELAEIGARLEAEAAERSQLESRLPELEHRERAMVEASASRRAAARRLEELAAAAATLRTDLEVRAAGLEERRRVLATRLAEVEDRLRSHVAERQQAAARRTRLEATVVALDRLAVLVRAHDLQLEAGAAELRERRRRQAEHTRAASEHLDGLRRRRSEAERTLEQVRERAQRAAIEEAEARLRLETIVETIRRDLDCEPAVAKAASCPALPEGASAQGRLRDLEREIRLLGPVNPLALEEHAALQERHGFLESQLEDVKSSRRELAKVIRAIDVEIIDVFAAAYADVSDNFTKLFATLFPGGSGHLRLTDPDNLLETGIEIEGRPSGKNVRRLSLLSGGERSLIAIAFLFAVFRSRPSPFYLMDEVEAALDDVNLHRFLDLVHEFRDEAQLLIVSHQKRTMEAADCLYGVTMQPGGSSKVISEKIAAHT